MPSFNDDEGHVIILNAQGNIIDELKYDEKWHFKLIDNREGVALESIDYHAPTQNQDNWHSAQQPVLDMALQHIKIRSTGLTCRCREQ